MANLETKLSGEQRTLVHQWLPDIKITKDHSWGTIETTVLEATTQDGQQRFIIKAGGPSDHHMAREIAAHERWTAPWQPGHYIPRTLHADKNTKLLITKYLDGDLIQGHADYELKENRKLLRLLDQPHRIPAGQVHALRKIVTSWPIPPATIVPTHGDWQPRNWLIHHGEVRIIDLGRADLRPAHTDFVRLHFQQFVTVPGAETAFFEGYGHDPREPHAWYRERVQQAVATAVWAYGVGAESFELEGRADLTRLLASSPG